MCGVAVGVGWAGVLVPWGLGEGLWGPSAPRQSRRRVFLTPWPEGPAPTPRATPRRRARPRTAGCTRAVERGEGCGVGQLPTVVWRRSRSFPHTLLKEETPRRQPEQLPQPPIVNLGPPHIHAWRRARPLQAGEGRDAGRAPSPFTNLVEDPKVNDTVLRPAGSTKKFGQREGGGGGPGETTHGPRAPGSERGGGGGGGAQGKAKGA